jgi:signal transduction histidine kinase
MNATSNLIYASEAKDKSLWYLLGLRSSLGLRVIGLFIIPGALSPLFIDRATFGGSYFLWFGLIALAHLSFSIALLICRQIIHGNRKHESHPVKTLVAFLIAQSIRGSVLGFSVVNLGFTDDPQLSFRIFSGGIFIGIVLSILAISVAEFDVHSDLVRNLQAQTNELESVRESMEDRLQIADENLRTFAVQMVSPRISQIDEQLSALKSGGDKGLALEQLQHYVDDELRPFSHKIAHDPITSLDSHFSKQDLKRYQIPRRINIANSFRPRLSTLLFQVTLLAASQRSMTVVEALPVALFTTLFFLFYFVLFQKIFVGRELATLPGTITGLTIFAIVGPLSLTISELLGLATPEHIKIAVIFVGLVFGAANFGFTLLTSQRTEMANQLSEAIEQMASVVSILRQREWIARRRVSYVMHGTLQSSLNAAVLKLGASSSPSPEMIDQIRSEISHALDRIWQDRSEDYSFAKAQQEITNIWEGTVQVNWKLADGVSQALDANPTTAECLGEVVREAVSNASRHGGANWLEIQINREDSKVLVKATDNGSNQNTGKAQGLGSELFDDVCSSWTLDTNPGGGMTLRANLQLKA